MSDTRCPTCGCPVKVMGGTTKYYVPVHDEAVARLVECLTELVEVADLRGDSDLPHPSNDPKLWTARMQDAWDNTRAALAPFEEGK